MPGEPREQRGAASPSADQHDLLSRFLRSRRGRITLEQAGLPARRGSRTGTVTQEDLARLTGYSVRTISSLEQGTDHRPTHDLLEALSVALRLTPDERHTLWYLAADAPAPARAASARTDQADGLDPGLLRLLQVLEPHLAYVTDGVRTVKAWTDACARWGSDFGAMPENRRNLAHWVFLDPHARHMYPYWELSPRGAAWRTCGASYPGCRTTPISRR